MVSVAATVGVITGGGVGLVIDAATGGVLAGLGTVFSGTGVGNIGPFRDK